MKIVSAITGIALCVDAVVMGIMANYNAGVLLTLLIGLIMIIYGFCRRRFAKKQKSQF